MRPIIKLFGSLLAPTANRFNQALEEPQKAQNLVQEEILNHLVQSDYGKALGIQSIADWHHIPIIEYQQIEAWIERQREAQISLLTSEPILFYEKTSGSFGTAKWIPYTKSLRASFNSMFCVWAHDLISYDSKFSTGKLYFCISPQLGEVTTNAGLEDDSEYLDGWLRWFLRPFLVSPSGINRLRDPEIFKEKLSLSLLQEEHLEIISIWSPSFLKVLLDYIQEHQKELYSQLKNQISSQRSQLLLKSEIPWKQIWPHLKLISCWDSAHSADQATFLRSLFPGVMVQGKGLLATEAPMTIPLIEAQGCVPVLNEVFFEFNDEAGKICLLHELEIGKVYEIILSQKGGLYRYRIGDRVQVTHFYKATPCLEFRGRTEVTSDLVGEKLHTDFVRDVLAELALEVACFKSLVPVKNPIAHYILLLDSSQESAEAITHKLDEALMRSYHYRQARLLGQLAPARVLVSRKIPETISLYRTHSGSNWGDLKHPILVTTPLDEELLTDLESVSYLPLSM
jgi:hypothetical protein